MSLFREFARDVRRGAPRRMKIAAIILGVPLVIATIFVGVKAWDAWNQSGVDGNVIDKVPLPALVAANVQALDCIRVGETVCPQYGEAKDYLVRASAAEGVTYTPLTGQENPGTVQDDGTVRLVLASDLPDTDWHAFAAAATLNGTANVDTVTDKSVSTIDPLSGSFRVRDESGTTKTGTMVFDLAQAGLILVSVTYGTGE